MGFWETILPLRFPGSAWPAVAGAIEALGNAVGLRTGKWSPGGMVEFMAVRYTLRGVGRNRAWGWVLPGVSGARLASGKGEVVTFKLSQLKESLLFS